MSELEAALLYVLEALPVVPISGYFHVCRKGIWCGREVYIYIYVQGFGWHKNFQPKHPPFHQFWVVGVCIHHSLARAETAELPKVLESTAPQGLVQA